MSASGGTYSVRLFAGLEAQTRDGRSVHDVTAADAPTVASLAAHLGLPPGAAGLVLVNGLHAASDHELRPGDEVTMFPPLGGG